MASYIDDFIVQANRTLDALVAERVKGWKRFKVPSEQAWMFEDDEVLVPPSETVETMRRGFSVPPRGGIPFDYWVAEYSKNYYLAPRLLEKHFAPPKYFARLTLTESGNWRCDIELRGGDGPVISAAAETLPLAICLAALEAVGMTPHAIRDAFIPF